MAENDLNEILEQESMEVDTPMQPTRIVKNIKQESVPSVTNSNNTFQVPCTFSKESVNPVKNYTQTPIDELISVNQIAKSRVNLKNGVLIRELKEHAESANTHTFKKLQEPNKSRGLARRKHSQLTTKDHGDNYLKAPRLNSKGSQVVPKIAKTNEKRQITRNSSREGTVSSMSIDFDRMDKARDEQYSDYSKQVSAGNNLNRLEDQRRRLESFLSLAQQAKSKRDINKIQDMIKQIDETGKPLPMSRINELRMLELMASPYNQSLIAMIKVELDISRKMKELKKAQQSHNATQKSKFSLPKHLTTQNSKLLRENESRDTFSHGFMVSKPGKDGHESDSRLTTVVNIKPLGIASCRSNNDVARRTFARSPSDGRHQSPLSQVVCQPVLSGNNRNDSNGRRDSSVNGRYSYLRGVGNAVVQTDVRKSVDRIRMSVNQDSNQQITNKSQLEMASGYDESKRRGTAPNFDESELPRQHKSSLNNYNKLDKIAIVGQSYNAHSSQASSQNELLSLNNGVINYDNQQMSQQQQHVRSNTSYGVVPPQHIGIIMGGQEGFVKRITPLQSKSALDHNNKENSAQQKDSH